MSKQWIIPPPSPDVALGVTRWRTIPIVAQVLINRGFSADGNTDGFPADQFLNPALKDLHPPNLLPGATRAAEILQEAINAKSRIVIYGDYDVDGTTGAAILWHALRLAGADVSVYVPHRIEEGYGLNRDAVRRLAADGARLIVTVDCGITAVDIARELSETDVRLIITDHHAPGSALPNADAIVHPTAEGSYPNPGICGAGVALKVAWALGQRLSGSARVDARFRELLVQLLPLAALGTIADVVPLLGENRIIVTHGLRTLPQSPLPGVQALIESAGLRGSRIDGFDVGFKLAPRINAAGRMGHARLAVELLTDADAARAKEIALYLNDHNRKRQAVQRSISEQAMDRIERNDLACDARRAIVLAGEDWHAGVIGIVCSKIVERYRRPTVLIAMSSDGNGDEGQGSARSIEHFDLAAAMADCDEHLLAHGGHAMAAGLRIAGSAVNAFTEAFVSLANNRLTGTDLVEKLRLDATVPLTDLTMSLTDSISRLGPFGSGNPKPRFASDWVELAAEPRCVGKAGDHLQAMFRQNGTSIRAIGFGLAGSAEELKHRRRCRVAFEPMVNDFNGRRSVEMQIIDIQFP